MKIGDKVVHIDSDMMGVLVAKLEADLNLIDEWYKKHHGIKYSKTFGTGKFGEGQLWLMWEDDLNSLQPVFESELMLDREL